MSYLRRDWLLCTAEFLKCVVAVIPACGEDRHNHLQRVVNDGPYGIQVQFCPVTGQLLKLREVDPQAHTLTHLLVHLDKILYHVCISLCAHH